jgi:hypothetical protein
MNVIHFTCGATDSLTAFGSKDVYFIPLTDGSGESHPGCVHLDRGAAVSAHRCRISTARRGCVPHS